MSEHDSTTGRAGRFGLSAVEMLVILVLIAAAAMFLLMAVPRGREQARLAACQKNLAQVGMALSNYDQIQRLLPAVGRLDPVLNSTSSGVAGPLRALLETLGLQDFRALQPNAPPPPAKVATPGELPVPGFVCSSDPNATSGIFRAPISYRALTGSDELGRDGPFAPKRPTSLARVEANDGTSYTAGFSERLVGTGVDNQSGATSYAVTSGPLPRDGCSLFYLARRQTRWRGDAGSSWWAANYVSTLYNHGLPPGAALSCLADDGGSAFQGASSGHVRGVNLLMLDGSVRLVQPRIDPEVWKAYATVQSPASDTVGP